MKGLRTLSRHVLQFVTQKLRALERISFLLKICSALGSAVACWAQFSKDDTIHTIGIGGAAFGLFCALLLILSERGAAAELAVATSFIDASRRRLMAVEQDRAYYEREINRLRQLHGAQVFVRTFVEGLLADGCTETTDDLLEYLLTQMRRPLLIALGFSTEAHYSFCVYRKVMIDGGKQELELAGHVRSIDCDKAKARRWGYGVGVGGTCLAKGSEVIVADIAAEQLGTLTELPHELMKPEDGVKHRSFVAEPIRVENGCCWGVLVATNSAPNHFSTADKRYVSAAESFAGVIGLVLRAATLKPHNPPEEVEV
jgi:hypothetical protein